MNNHLVTDSQPVDLAGEEVDALRGRYIRRLTAVLIHHIPAFWKVALSVFSGKFAKVFDVFCLIKSGFNIYHFIVQLISKKQKKNK